MPRIKHYNVGRLGLNRDLPASRLPPELWNYAYGCRFFNNKIQQMPGVASIATPTADYHHLFLVSTPAQVLYLGMGLTAAYSLDEGLTETDVTRASGAYTANNTDPITGGMFGTLPIINNTADNPQQWGTGGYPGSADKLQDLSNWPPGDLSTSCTCRVLRPVGNYLFALNTVEDGVTEPLSVRWSDEGDPGSPPSTWDITDATAKAGKHYLASGQTQILDARELSEQLLIYTEGKTVMAQFIGGTFVWDFSNVVLSQSGILATGCVIPFADGKHHFVVTQDDIIVFNGRDVERIAEGRVRNFLFSSLDDDTVDLTFVATNYRYREVWIFYNDDAETSGLGCLKALIWNWAYNTWYELDVFAALGDPVLHAVQGRAFGLTSSDAWDAGADEQWDAGADIPWQTALVSGGFQDLVISQGNENTARALLAADLDTTSLHDMTIYREEIALIDTDLEGKLVADPATGNLIVEVWIEATGGSIDITLSTRERLSESYGNSQTRTLDPDSARKVDFYISGKYFKIQIASKGETPVVNLHNIHYEVRRIGKY